MLEFLLLAGFTVFAVYITVRSSDAKKEVAAPDNDKSIPPPKNSLLARVFPGRDVLHSIQSDTANAL